MTMGQQSLFKNQAMFSVLHKQAESIGEHERVPGYSDALKEALDRIVMHEKANLSAKTQIQKQVDTAVRELAGVLLREDWKPSQ